jgi:hypothetical protein
VPRPPREQKLIVAPSNVMTLEDSAFDSSFRRVNKHLHMFVSALNIRTRTGGDKRLWWLWLATNDDIEKQH